MGGKPCIELSSGDAILLDYGSAATADLLRNISGAARCADFLWTVSDEGRTIECLHGGGDFYQLDRQFAVDEFVEGIPGAETRDELDLEAISCDGADLWISGSHCKVRRKPEPGTELNWELKNRKSRRLLARFRLGHGGGEISGVNWAPLEGPGSLREALEQDIFLQPFAALPSKENGIDIEGLAVHGEKVFVGLRGPVVDNLAVVFKLKLKDDFRIGSVDRFFLDLGGLGVRDMVWMHDRLLVLAGPVGDASGPFRLHLWQPGKGSQTIVLHSWGDLGEKPEGICWLNAGDYTDLMVLYDSPQGDRVSGNRYRADRFRVFPK